MQTSVSTYEQDKNTADSSNKNRTQCNDSREDYNWDEVRALESHWDKKKKRKEEAVHTKAIRRRRSCFLSPSINTGLEKRP